MSLNINAWDTYVHFWLSTFVPFCWDLTGPFFPLHHRKWGPSGMYRCNQSSLNHNTYTPPGELYERHWIWVLSSTPTLSPCTVYTHFLSTTKSLLDWGNSHRSPLLQRKVQAHFVWCWLDECRIQPHLVTVLMPKKKLCYWKADPPASLTFIFQNFLVAERESNMTCLVWLCEKLALYKSYGQNTTRQQKIKILFLI